MISSFPLLGGNANAAASLIAASAAAQGDPWPLWAPLALVLTAVLITGFVARLLHRRNHHPAPPNLAPPPPAPEDP